jgi:dTDP-4-dehydrorhamnose 3,5-epimerase
MSNRFDVSDTSLQGLKLIQRKPSSDSRGYLERMFCSDELKELIPGKNILQINHAFTAKCGSVRGLHFQYSPDTEAKFVSCLRGEVFDVAVDLRRGSPSFLCWHAEILNSKNHKTFLIPEGFAHGFQTLTRDCEILYFHTAHYRPASEGGVNATDPKLAIQWPMTITEQSDRDIAHPMLNQDFKGLDV